jgi:hypothetical protein
MADFPAIFGVLPLPRLSVSGSLHHEIQLFRIQTVFITVNLQSQLLKVAFDVEARNNPNMYTQ